MHKCQGLVLLLGHGMNYLELGIALLARPVSTPCVLVIKHRTIAFTPVTAQHVHVVGQFMGHSQCQGATVVVRFRCLGCFEVAIDTSGLVQYCTCGCAWIRSTHC